jgi:hypothetical protein
LSVPIQWQTRREEGASLPLRFDCGQLDIIYGYTAVAALQMGIRRRKNGIQGNGIPLCTPLFSDSTITGTLESVNLDATHLDLTLPVRLKLFAVQLLRQSMRRRTSDDKERLLTHERSTQNVNVEPRDGRFAGSVAPSSIPLPSRARLTTGGNAQGC